MRKKTLQQVKSSKKKQVVKHKRVAYCRENVLGNVLDINCHNYSLITVFNSGELVGKIYMGWYAVCVLVVDFILLALYRTWVYTISKSTMGSLQLFVYILHFMSEVIWFSDIYKIGGL